jgi:hypothetical protein
VPRPRWFDTLLVWQMYCHTWGGSATATPTEKRGQAPHGHSYPRAFACRFGASPLFSTDRQDPLCEKYTPLPEMTQMSLVSSIAVDYLEEVAVQDG